MPKSPFVKPPPQAAVEGLHDSNYFPLQSMNSCVLIVDAAKFSDQRGDIQSIILRLKGAIYDMYSTKKHAEAYHPSHTVNHCELFILCPNITDVHPNPVTGFSTRPQLIDLSSALTDPSHYVGLSRVRRGEKT